MFLCFVEAAFTKDVATVDIDAEVVDAEDVDAEDVVAEDAVVEDVVVQDVVVEGVVDGVVVGLNRTRTLRYQSRCPTSGCNSSPQSPRSFLSVRNRVQHQ